MGQLPEPVEQPSSEDDKGPEKADPQVPEVSEKKDAGRTKGQGSRPGMARNPVSREYPGPFKPADKY